MEGWNKVKNLVAQGLKEMAIETRGAYDDNQVLVVRGTNTFVFGFYHNPANNKIWAVLSINEQNHYLDHCEANDDYDTVADAFDSFLAEFPNVLKKFLTL